MLVGVGRPEALPLKRAEMFSPNRSDAVRRFVTISSARTEPGSHAATRAIQIKRVVFMFVINFSGYGLTITR